jgi:lipopolysaccharide transport system ATP-binding protein
MLDDGTTFIYVTHAADSIRALCKQGIWMERGRVRMTGTSSNVGAAYQSEIYRRMVHAQIGMENGSGETGSAPDKQPGRRVDYERHKAFEERVAPLRTGSGDARIQDIALVGEDGAETDSVPFHSRCRVRVFYRVERDLPANCGLTLGVTDSSGRQVLHFNSASHGISVSSDGSRVLRVVEFEFVNPLCPGEYGLIAGIGTFSSNPLNNGQRLVDEIIDYCIGGARFAIRYPDEESSHDLWGLVHLSYSVNERVLD